MYALPMIRGLFLKVVCTADAYVDFHPGWAQYTFWVLSITLVSSFAAVAAFVVSRALARSRPLSEGIAILLFSLSNLSVLLSMVALLSESSRAEAFRDGLQQMAYERCRDDNWGHSSPHCTAYSSDTWVVVNTFLIPLFIFAAFAVRAIRAELDAEGTPSSVKGV